MTAIDPTPTAPISAAAALVGDPAQWGYVADDGTVFVRTTDGDRAVGSYPGKSAEEALSYFVRKFETLAAEVALTSARLRSGAITAEDGTSAIKRLRDQVENLNAVGDLAALKVAVANIAPIAEERRAAEAVKKAAAAEAKAIAREASKVLKEALVIEAEAVAAKDAWKVSGDRLKEILDEWKKAPRLDRKTDEALWKRFSAARNGFDKRRRTHFASLDAARSQVATAKEALVKEAETLATSTNWVSTARRFKELMDLWKASGRGSKAEDEKFWSKFKAAQDAFFTSKNADLEKLEANHATNLAVKSELATEAEALLPITDLAATKKSLRTLMEKWEKSGAVGKKDKDRLDARLRAVEHAIRDAEQHEWRRTDPAGRARAEDTVRQLSEAIEGYLKQGEKATKAGNEKKANEALAAAEARREWLAEAERTLAEFSR
jgi:hypothetical protein